MSTTDRRAEFLTLLQRSGLQKKQIARLLGKTAVSVDRWTADPARPSYIEVPLFALNFLRAFMLLPKTEQLDFLEKHASD